MEKILVSGCLAGFNTKYDGKNNFNPKIEELKKKYDLIYICPEVDGGLSIPRDPSERIKDKVISCKGIDVTKEFTLGAEKALRLAKENHIKKAILKDGSPSCGVTYIYDGTFSHKKVRGQGKTSEMLKAIGVQIYSENEIDELL